MKKIIISSLVAIVATALIGCETTTNTNVRTNANMATMNANANTIIVTNVNANERADARDDDWNANITREEYDKDRGRYETRAKEAGSTIGSGANDLWIWTKTRAALATTNDLRDSTINVDVENNVVTLRGTVGSAAQKAAAVKVARGIEGVTSVKDTGLTVNANDSLANQATTDNDTRTNTNANMKK